MDTPSHEKGQKEEVQVFQNEKFTIDALKKAWQKYTDKKQEQGASAEYTILNQEIELEGEYIVKVKLTNPLQEDILERFRKDLLNYLRTTLKNSEIRLQSEIVQQTGRKMIYTPQEKFNHLAEKHPMLIELSRRLGLDTDF